MKDYAELAKALLEKAKNFSPDAARVRPLQSLADFIKGKIAENKPILLNFICTHNSRRSHFGQILAQVLATYLKIPNTETYSGGTEATAFHPHAVEALRTLGVAIEKLDNSANPKYKVTTGTIVTEALSKVFSHAPNPQKNFAAIMVCSSADEACPFVAGAEKRISLPFEDPKKSDGTPEQAETYRARALQIGTELAWAFQRAVS